MTTEFRPEGLRERIRLVVRLGVFAVWVVFLLGLRALVLPIVLVSKRFERVSRRFLFQTGVRGLMRLFGFKIDVKGVLPKPPFLLVCNHQSYVDIFIMTALFGCVFVSMAEVRKWPLIGILAGWLHTIFIDRKAIRDTKRVNGLIKEALDSGEGFVLFPEGGTAYGVDVRPFKPALLDPAAQARWPVHYVTLRYRALEGCPPASTTIVWTDGAPFFPHANRLFKLPGMQVTATFGDEPITDPDRKALAERLRQAVEAQLPPKSEST